MSATTNPTPTTTTPAAPSAKPRRRKPGRAVRIPNVPWEMYEELLKVFERKRNLKLTYNRGELEIMVPSQEHEADADMLAALVVILTKEFRLPIHRGGSTTLKRMKLKKGLEPDKCFWIANAPKMAGVRQLDLKIHPPPDLAIEVDVTRSSLNKLSIYAKLGIAEVWRLEGDDLRFYVLGASKKYVEVSTSRAFAGITPGDLMQFVIQARGVADQNITTDAFEVWLKQRIAAAASPPPPPTTAP